ncbi:MAG: hypothetical protein AAGN46_02520 [Acidobacteriota bacterium]
MFAEWIALALVAFGPNGWMVEQQLSSSRFAGRACAHATASHTTEGASRSACPHFGWIVETARPLWIVPSPWPAGALAAYLPADARDGRQRLVARETVYFAATGALVPLDALPLDAADYWLAALLEARLDPARQRTAEWGDRLETGAAALLQAVPESQRATIYRRLLADIGAWMLATQLEVGRLAQRHGPRLCSLMQREVALFGLWRRQFEALPFTVAWRRTDGSDAWTPPPGAAERELVLDLLDAEWTGVPADDFSWACPSPGPQPRSAKERGA